MYIISYVSKACLKIDVSTQNTKQANCLKYNYVFNIMYLVDHFPQSGTY